MTPFTEQRALAAPSISRLVLLQGFSRLWGASSFDKEYRRRHLLCNRIGTLGGDTYRFRG